MIAVKAIYERGKIQFLEPLPEIAHALVVVIFLETNLSESAVNTFVAKLSTRFHKYPDVLASDLPVVPTGARQNANLFLREP